MKSFTRGASWKLCASTAVDEPAFGPIKYWRGPIWVNVNWMIHHGLRRYGMDDLAARVKADTLQLLQDVGMFEYFDARPANPDEPGLGERGLGADQFSWSAALALDLLEDPTALT